MRRYRFLRKELQEEAACKELPMSILLFVVFLLSLVLHTKPYVVRARVGSASCHNLWERHARCVVGPSQSQYALSFERIMAQNRKSSDG